MRYIILILFLTGCTLKEEYQEKKEETKLTLVPGLYLPGAMIRTKVIVIDSMAVYQAMVKKLVGTNQAYEHGYYRGHQEASDFIQNALNKGHNVINRNGRSYLDTTYWKLLKTDSFEFPEN